MSHGLHPSQMRFYCFALKVRWRFITGKISASDPTWAVGQLSSQFWCWLFCPSPKTCQADPRPFPIPCPSPLVSLSIPSEDQVCSHPSCLLLAPCLTWADCRPLNCRYLSRRPGKSGKGIVLRNLGYYFLYQVFTKHVHKPKPLVSIIVILPISIINHPIVHRDFYNPFFQIKTCIMKLRMKSISESTSDAKISVHSLVGTTKVII